MLYLEDYLEMIEHLPQELRDRFTEMRELDLQVHNAMDRLEEQVQQFFSNAKRMKVEQRDEQFQKILKEYYKTLEDGEEKIHLANQNYELVDRYLRRLDSEVQKFKHELEADNSGITEVLEKRSLELDNPPSNAMNNVREKRKYNHHTSHTSSNSINNPNYIMSHYERQVPLPTEKVLTSIAQEAMRETVSNPSGVITSSNITNNRLNSNAFTPLLAVVNANNSPSPNSNNYVNSSINPMSNLVSNDRSSNSTFVPQSFRCNLGNNAIAAAASQAIAATQQMQQGRRTASLKASYEAINSGFPNMCGLSHSLRDQIGFESSISHNDLVSPFPSTSSSGLGLDSFNRPNRMKKNRSSSHYTENSCSNLSMQGFFDDESSEAILADDNGATDWAYDPNEPRYCICNQVSYGDMVACDNEDCQKEWFHYGCVGINQPPKGKWFCPDCSEKMSKRKNRKERS